jgi:hypothetical protein
MGMLLGNTISGISIGLSAVLEEFYTVRSWASTCHRVSVDNLLAVASQRLGALWLHWCMWSSQNLVGLGGLCVQSHVCSKLVWGAGWCDYADMWLVLLFEGCEMFSAACESLSLV